MSATNVRPAFVPLTREGDVLPDVPLIDQNGKAFSLRRSGAPTILSFVYTRCTDARMCPLVTAKFGYVRKLLSGKGIRLVEISLDPAYDRPAILRLYARAVGAEAPTWIFATGRPADVLELSGRLGIVSERRTAATLAHTEVVAVVDGNGTLARLIEGGAWSAQDVATAARATAALPPDTLRRVAFTLFARVGAACGLPGAGGLPLIAVLAIFAAFTALGGWGATRLAPALFLRDASAPRCKRKYR